MKKALFQPIRALGILPVSVFLSRLIIGSVFIYTGLGKISHLSGFAQDIDSYQILPEFLVNITAVYLPWLELFCGMLLILGLFSRAAGILVLAMNIVFTVAIMSAVWRGLEIGCGCFGSGGTSEILGVKEIVRDLLYVALSVVIVTGKDKLLSLDCRLRENR